ncbi:7378_t:CDS:2 [Acaulospora colombiana]|uniref:7378_t:CDS:1 n=1 Tax=Acaulospora colombiana TaxID=27376 RepID=A0ACA9K0D5_9GLOM|nr:7378_t:CDS:2 [Acaulospora colombiana]
MASLQAQLVQPAQVHPQNNEASADFEKLNTKIASLEAQLAESMQAYSKLAQHLQLPKKCNQELEKRLGNPQTIIMED